MRSCVLLSVPACRQRASAAPLIRDRSDLAGSPRSAAHHFVLRCARDTKSLHVIPIARQRIDDGDLLHREVRDDLDLVLLHDQHFLDAHAVTETSCRAASRARRSCLPGCRPDDRATRCARSPAGRIARDRDRGPTDWRRPGLRPRSPRSPSPTATSARCRAWWRRPSPRRSSRRATRARWRRCPSAPCVGSLPTQ